MHSFNIYIDESGDDGLAKFRQPNGSGGASQFLVLTAFIVRASRDLELVEWRDEIKNNTRKNSKGRRIHFADFNHNQRRVATQNLGKRPARIVSIICHKPSLNPDNFNDKNRLYFYLTRMLLERVSWLCRDFRRNVKEGDGQAKIIFSRRGGMSYSDFRIYMSKLKDNGETSIFWKTINIDLIDAQDHSKLAGLQLADCCASSMAYSIEPDLYGNIETQYIQALMPLIYSHKGNKLNYGVKFHPPQNSLSLNQQQLNCIKMIEN